MKSGQKKTLKSVNLKGLVGMPLDPFAAEAKRIEAEEAEKQDRGDHDICLHIVGNRIARNAGNTYTCFMM